MKYENFLKILVETRSREHVEECIETFKLINSGKSMELQLFKEELKGC